MRTIKRRMWVIEQVNSQTFIGRFDGRWTRTCDLDAAALWQSRGEADNAFQALLAEASDRCANAKEHWPSQFWWDLYGGLTLIREVVQTTGVVESAQSADAVATPSEPATPVPSREKEQ
jgi:hypothetical protein